MDRYLITETDFINSESRKWGEQEIESLLNKGFAPKLTTEGWKWIHVASTVRQRLAA